MFGPITTDIDDLYTEETYNFDTQVIVKRMNRFTQSGKLKKTKEDIHKSIADHRVLVRAAGASYGKVGPRDDVRSAAMKTNGAADARTESQNGEG